MNLTPSQTQLFIFPAYGSQLAFPGGCFMTQNKRKLPQPLEVSITGPEGHKGARLNKF